MKIGSIRGHQPRHERAALPWLSIPPGAALQPVERPTSPRADRWMAPVGAAIGPCPRRG